MKINLDLFGMGLSGENRHPEHVMKSFGMTWEKAVPQSLFDAWQFFGGKNVPDKLPDWITPVPD